MVARSSARVTWSQGALVPVAADQPARQNAVGGNAKAQVADERQDGVLDPARDQRILDLEIADRMSGGGSPDRVDAHLAEADAADVTRCHHVGDRAHPSPRSARGDRGAPGGRCRCSRGPAPAASRRGSSSPRPAGSRIAPNLTLTRKRSRAMPFSASPISISLCPPAVEIAGIQQGDPGIKRRMDGGDAFLSIRRAIHARHAHAAEAESRDRRTLFPKSTMLHGHRRQSRLGREDRSSAGRSQCARSAAAT
jgi:hypothetical protein